MTIKPLFPFNGTTVPLCGTFNFQQLTSTILYT